MNYYSVDPEDGTDFIASDSVDLGVKFVPAQTRLAESISEVEFSIIAVDEGVCLAPVDLPWFRFGLYPLRERAYQRLRHILEAAGEVIPIRTTGDSMWIFNCLRVIDALDHERSDIDRFDDGRIMDVYNPVLIGSRVSGDVFYVRGCEGGPLIVSESVAGIIDANQLTGWRLQELAVSS